ncbi:hypothetical protein KEM55_008891 [Ascosphaera atra]|nr:hypothetical protein KEM55_008891 [Ascosphaera atra]
MSRLELFSDYLQQSRQKDDGASEERGAEQRVVTVTSNNSHTDTSNDRDRSAPTTIQSAAAMADPQLISGHNDANGNAPESATIIAPGSSSPHLTAQESAATTTAQSGNLSYTIATNDQKLVRNDQGNGSENGSGTGSGTGSTYTGKAMPSFRR